MPDPRSTDRSPMHGLFRILAAALVPLLCSCLLHAQTAGAPGGEPLAIVQEGRPLATVIVSAAAGELEKAAAADLVKYVELMTGAKLPVAVLPAGSRPPVGPAILVGQAALAADGSLAARLRAAAKKDPVVNADAIVRRRVGDHLYLAGNNDRAHYFAVARLLQDWGCRWYMPTEFGEVVPEHRSLDVGRLDEAYGSPFEIRSYWLSWRGDNTGREEFQRRNFANATQLPVFGHALGTYTKELIPPGKSAFNVPLSEPATAAAVVRHIEAEYAKGVPGISLAIEDGLYRNESASDRALQARIVDKYMLALSNTDAMVALYNDVARSLRQKYPASPTKIGGLAYSNVTLPPQRITGIEPNIVMWLAPIDIDPNHGMDDPRSPPKQEYKGVMYRWAELLKGRLAIYDYDQGQLVWRDLPNPSHQAFAQDVRHYRKAGILGVNTESRGATATTFLNLFLRLQLLWNPDADVDALLAEFYPKFYGPAAGPMAQYWNAIFAAWKDTVVTEHEHFVAPAIYTPELIDRLRSHLVAAQQAIAPLRSKADPGRNEKLYIERMRFTELSFAIIENYLAMVRAAATDGDYARAAAAGEKALAAREQLTAMNPTFTTYKGMGEQGYAWLPGEVQQMRELAALIDGSNGTLVARTPLHWSFRRDPYDTGLARGWAYTPWTTGNDGATERLRTDLYLQAQGVLMPDAQSFIGFYWYQVQLDLSARDSAGALRLMLPGLFNECWLYVNGKLVDHRPVREPWWRTDYRFEWDVDLQGRLQPGRNVITLRGFNPHHFGGMFRRPFLYRAGNR
jgi:hypothetical protein